MQRCRLSRGFQHCDRLVSMDSQQWWSRSTVQWLGGWLHSLCPGYIDQLWNLHQSIRNQNDNLRLWSCRRLSKIYLNIFVISIKKPASILIVNIIIRSNKMNKSYKITNYEIITQKLYSANSSIFNVISNFTYIAIHRQLL